MRITRTCFFLVISLFIFTPVSSARAANTAVSADWTWDILVVPPDDGWDGETGKSVRSTLLWHSDEISETGEGLLGRDVEFVFLPPLSEEEWERYVLPLTPRTIAVFSFASWPVDRNLAAKIKGKGVPLMLAGGENVFFYENGELLSFVFALDLFRDSRSRAFAYHAARTLAPATRVGIIGARFTLFEERDARICSDLMDQAGLIPLPFWVDASARDAYGLVEQEIKSYGNGVLVSFAGGMATRELWRAFAHTSSWRLWYGGEPTDAFLSYEGIVFADQNRSLKTEGGFEDLKRHLWATRVVAVTDTVAAGRANALVLWVTGALSGVREGAFNPAAFPSLLAGTRGIPFGNQVLDIDPKTHRPAARRFFILETRNRRFHVVDTLNVEGLQYYDYEAPRIF